MTTTRRREIAVGLIVAEDGRLLLQLRDDKPGVLGGGKWGFFGGHLESGEPPATAFLREMQEELGWQPRNFEHYKTVDVDRDGWRVTSHAFAAHLNAPSEALTLGEGQAMALFAPNDLPDNTTPSVRPVIEEFAGSAVYRRARKAWEKVTATALIVDAQGRFLLQHRDDKPWIYNPGMWGSFGGEIEPGETPHDGLLRELREELSWQPERIDLYGAYPYEHGRLLIYVFTTVLNVPLDRLVLAEGQGMDVYAPDALPVTTVPELRMLIEQFSRSESYVALRRA